MDSLKSHLGLDLNSRTCAVYHVDLPWDRDASGQLKPRERPHGNRTHAVVQDLSKASTIDEKGGGNERTDSEEME